MNGATSAAHQMWMNPFVCSDKTVRCFVFEKKHCDDMIACIKPRDEGMQKLRMPVTTQSCRGILSFSLSQAYCCAPSPVPCNCS